jgi:FixJ family two-component response regulator
VTDIREILRRLQLGEPDRRIARALDVSRNTVARYRRWASRHGVLDGGALPDAATIATLLEPAPTERPAHEQSLVEPWRARVLA